MIRIRHDSSREQAHRLLANLQQGWAQTCYLDPASTCPELLRHLERLARAHSWRVEVELINGNATHLIRLVRPKSSVYKEEEPDPDREA